MASPASQLQQFGSSFTAATPVLTVGSWKESALHPQQPWLLAVLTQEGGAGAALAQRCLQLLQSWAPWTSNADPSPEAALAGPQDHHPPALGTRSEDKQDLIYSCPLLHACHLCSLSARGGGSKHDPVFPAPSHAVEVKQSLKSSGFTSLSLKPAEGVDSPCRALPVAGTLVGATVMSQFRLRRNPIGTSLLKATS